MFMSAAANANDPVKYNDYYTSYKHLLDDFVKFTDGPLYKTWLSQTAGEVNNEIFKVYLRYYCKMEWTGQTPLFPADF